MVTFLWILAAFVAGGCAGVVVMALMCMAGGLPPQSASPTQLKGSYW